MINNLRFKEIMRIEKRYYTQHKNETIQIWEEIEYKNSLLSDEEKIREKDYVEKNVEKIIKKYELEYQYKKRILDKMKVDSFSAICTQALLLAKYIILDVILESNDNYGKITFSAEEILIPEILSEKWKVIFANIIREADNLFIYRANGMINIELDFILTKDILRNV